MYISTNIWKICKIILKYVCSSECLLKIGIIYLIWHLWCDPNEAVFWYESQLFGWTTRKERVLAKGTRKGGREEKETVCLLKFDRAVISVCARSYSGMNARVCLELEVCDGTIGSFQSQLLIPLSLCCLNYHRQNMLALAKWFLTSSPSLHPEGLCFTPMGKSVLLITQWLLAERTGVYLEKDLLRNCYSKGASFCQIPALPHAKLEITASNFFLSTHSIFWMESCPFTGPSHGVARSMRPAGAALGFWGSPRDSGTHTCTRWWPHTLTRMNDSVLW